MTWTCVECTTVYSVGAPCCPHCGSTEHVETHMAKITRHGGASVEQDAPSLAAESAAATPEPEPVEAEPKTKPAPKRRSRSQAREKS